MGLFSSNYNRPGPGVPKDAPKKKGIKRFFEIVGRDMGDLFKLNLLFVLCCVPLFIAGYFTVLSFMLDPQKIYIGPILIGFVLILVAAIPFGPALCGVHSVLTSMLRDEPIYMWTAFKKAFKSNFKQAAPLGIVLAGLVALEAFAVVFYAHSLIISEGTPNVFLLALFFFNLLLIVLMSLYVFLQLIYMNLKVLPIIKNSILLSFAMAKRSLPAAIIVIVCIGACVLTFPVSMLFVILFAPVIMLLIADMWLWPTLEKTFHISELLEQRREERLLEDTEDGAINKDK